jgi:hypothetical protein
LFATDPKKVSKPYASLQGHSFDGSYGVDTEDIIGIPWIDFGSLYVIFRLFGSAHTIDVRKANSSRTKPSITLRQKTLLTSRLLETVENG